MSFSISSPSTTWYPASGFRSASSGSLSNVGYYGRCWSASPSGYYAYYMGFDCDGSVYLSNDDTRAGGRAVRCVQE